MSAAARQVFSLRSHFASLSGETGKEHKFDLGLDAPPIELVRPVRLDLLLSQGYALPPFRSFLFQQEMA